MADRIEANYETLAEIQKKFTQIAGDVSQLSKGIEGQVSELHNDGWQGEGSDAFYQEMDDTVAPAVRRLSAALEKAAEAAGGVTRSLRDAEEEVKGRFGAERR